MKSLAASFVVLALAACSSSTSPTTTGTSGNGSTTGARSTGTSGGANTGTGAGSGTGSAAGSSTGTPFGTACTFDTSGDDSCTDEGYECTAEFTNAATGTCVLPQDLAICDGDINMDVGCQDGGLPNNVDGGTGTGDLFCSAGFQNANNPMISLCLYSCSTTADCVILTQSCISQLSGCFENYCGIDQTTGTFTGPYFGTCPVLTADDGQCLAYNAAPNTRGICQPNGTAEAGEPCNPQFRFGIFSNCTYGNYCMPTASADGGLCFPITVDGGTCAAGDDVVLAQTGADWAVCATDCTTSMNCDGGPVGTTCQTPTGSAASFCLP